MMIKIIAQVDRQLMDDDDGPWPDRQTVHQNHARSFGWRGILAEIISIIIVIGGGLVVDGSGGIFYNNISIRGHLSQCLGIPEYVQYVE